MTHKTRFLSITFATGVVSFSYFIGSIFLKNNAFYLFDLLWRATIILIILFVAKYRPNISTKQWCLLLVVFATEFVAYTLLSPNYSIMRILISVAFAPLLEEFFFRGWMIEKISGTTREKIIVTSFLFGLYHLKNIGVLTTPALVTQIIYASFFIGPLLAWVRLKNNSLFASLVIHSGNNTFADVITSQIVPFITLRNESFK